MLGGRRTLCLITPIAFLGTNCYYGKDMVSQCYYPE